jgi:hypothetical protein
MIFLVFKNTLQIATVAFHSITDPDPAIAKKSLDPVSKVVSAVSNKN